MLALTRTKIPSGFPWESILRYSLAVRVGDQLFVYDVEPFGHGRLEASDAVVPSFTREVRLVDIVDQIPREELDEFDHIGYTIGGMMLFPGNRVGPKMTINGARQFAIEFIEARNRRIDTAEAAGWAPRTDLDP